MPEMTTNTYTRLGNLENIYYPNGARTYHQYNALNQLTNLVHYNGSEQVQAQYQYTVASDGTRLATNETRLEAVGNYSTTGMTWSQ